MSIDFAGKIKKLGGIENIEKMNSRFIQSNIVYISKIMGILPDAEILKFTEDFGFCMFNKNICINSNERNEFLKDGKIELGIIFGFGESNNSVKNIVKTYFKKEQINEKFYPLFEGYHGDIIFYSLENEKFGKIYYWHHESSIDEKKVLVENSFEHFFKKLYIVEDNSNKTLEQKIISVSYTDDFKKMVEEYKNKK